MSNTYDDQQIQSALSTLKGWEVKDNAIEKHFTFSDFKEALAAMVNIGAEAEEMNHHPEWTNVYNKLTVRLSTHDAGGITEKDVELARRIEEIVG